MTIYIYINFNYDLSNYKIDFLSTPFDEDAVDFLEPMVQYFKIASADITNFPLLKKVGQKKKITYY